MAYRFCDFELETPLVNGAGTINGTDQDVILEKVDSLAGSKISMINIGTLTIPPRDGNKVRFGEPVRHYDMDLNLLYNCEGLPGIGYKAAVRLAPEILMRAQDKDKPVIFSAAPTYEHDIDYGAPADQAAKLTYEFLAAGVDFVEIDASCRNLITAEGDRAPIMGNDPESLAELQETLGRVVGQGQRLGIKLPPFLTPSEKAKIPEIAKLFRDSEVFKYIVICNSIPDQIPVDINRRPILSVPGNRGSMTGPSTKPQGRDQLALWSPEIAEDKFVVSSLGIDSGREVALRRTMHADMVALSTILLRSYDWQRTINRVWRDYESAGAP